MTAAIPTRQRFIGGFLYVYQLQPPFQPQTEGLFVRLRNRFGELPGNLRHYTQACFGYCPRSEYGEGWQRFRFPDINESQTICICQSLLPNLDFQNYSIIRQQMSVIIRLASTGKTNTLLHVIGAFYAIDRKQSLHMALLEQFRQIWVDQLSNHH